MGEKRVVPRPLRRLLDWDTVMTDKFVKYVDRNYGPISKYKTTMKALEYSCHGIPWLLGTAAFIFLLQAASSRQLLVNIFIALIVDIVVVGVVKAITRRRRPATNKTEEMLVVVMMDKFSFPSGHCTRAVMLSVVISMQYDLFLPLWVLLQGWSGAVCVSRILLNRHHLLDVFGGIVIGVLEAWLMSQLWLSETSTAAVVNSFLDETQAGASYDI
ncbi:Phospholipid phosphatase 6 [Chionoecetes opilio]|uniref:Phospholipid phosphatase 6 n=1 Tax=Chionoecetes opilio TaxID=41210 RepID=A0A8J4YDX7_CHIOP|nr:Phospholipid phosphatase 6 [Chionoecetes opilio]